MQQARKALEDPKLREFFEKEMRRDEIEDNRELSARAAKNRAKRDRKKAKDKSKAARKARRLNRA